MPNPNHDNELGPDAVAPKERASLDEVMDAREAFVSNNLARHVIESIDDVALVLNPQRQVVYGNEAASKCLRVKNLTNLLAMRPGELVGCQNAFLGPHGCGTSSRCDSCCVVSAIRECLAEKTPQTRESRILTVENTALDFRARTSLIDVDGTSLMILTLRDISAEKRKAAMEAAFFHDALNTVHGISGLAEILQDDLSEADDHGYLADIVEMSGQLVEEVRSFRQLGEAEAGILAVENSDVDLSGLMAGITRSCEGLLKSSGVRLEVISESDITVFTDRVLVRRALHNLVRNAIEASTYGQTVQVTSCLVDGQATLRVHNAQVIAQHVQDQIFQRSFTTKAGTGRGIGSYSAKLLVENYLGGSLSFRSCEPDGTTFELRLPAGAG